MSSADGIRDDLFFVSPNFCSAYSACSRRPVFSTEAYASDARFSQTLQSDKARVPLIESMKFSRLKPNYIYLWYVSPTFCIKSSREG